MAAPARILSLNLGSQSVGLAEFHGQPAGGLVLTAFRMRDILADPASDSVRHAQVTNALREMLAELQIDRGKVNYAVASQAVFARFVKLPAVDEEKIERIIGFEAQQNVPFPIDEVVWDYQLVGGGTENKSRSFSSRSKPICWKGLMLRRKCRARTGAGGCRDHGSLQCVSL